MTDEVVVEEKKPVKKEVAPPDVEEESGELADEDKHWLQRLMDNPWLLLLLGLLIPFLSYTAWGWIELMMLSEAQLP